MHQPTALAWQAQLRASRLRITKPRRIIMGVLSSTAKHVSAEEIYMKVHQTAPAVGLTTVYRTLDLLVQCAGLEPNDRVLDLCCGQGRHCLELSRRGYILGIIANTITETEIPDYLEEYGLTEYFKTVVLSSKVGIRKPNPEIYWEAARRVGVEPSKCVYVGDNPVRDVEGTRAAGYAMMILILEPDTLKKEPPTVEVKPDYTILEIKELLDIFPPRKA